MVKDWKFHCAVLGVPENAPLKDVRKAYRLLALERHPDKHNGSHESHEAFQQLNESYKHVAAALIAGHRPDTTPPNPPNYGTHPKPPAPQPQFTTRGPHTARQFPRPPRNFKRVWIHAGLACTVLLLISIFLEQPQNRSPAHNKNYKPDLFPKSWCFVNSSENGQEIAELWSQRVCEEKCSTLAKQKDVSCEWSGEKFRISKAATPQAPAVPAIAAEIPTAACEISVEKLNGSSLSTPYRNQTEKTCASVCTEMMKEKSRDGVRCSWSGIEFKRQALIVQPKEAARIEQPPAALQVEGASSLRSTCYMSVVSEEGTFSEPIENQTYGSCEKRCMAEITAHPTGREVKCAFAGKQIITYVPDPMVSYMARDPGGSGFLQGNVFMATCEIFGRAGQKRILGRTDVGSETECQSACHFEHLKMKKGTEIVCSFNGINFFQETIRD